MEVSKEIWRIEIKDKCSWKYVVWVDKNKRSGEICVICLDEWKGQWKVNKLHEISLY